MRGPNRALRRLAGVGALSAALVSSVAPASAALRVGFIDQQYARHNATGFYADAAALHVGVLRFNALWRDIAPTKPAAPRDPGDPAYQFADLDALLRNAAAYGKAQIVLTDHDDAELGAASGRAQHRHEPGGRQPEREGRRADARPPRPTSPTRSRCATPARTSTRCRPRPDAAARRLLRDRQRAVDPARLLPAVRAARPREGRQAGARAGLPLRLQRAQGARRADALRAGARRGVPRHQAVDGRQPARTSSSWAARSRTSTRARSCASCAA